VTSKERIAAVASGAVADRIPFAPTVFEHAAYLIGKMPSEVAVSSTLMAKAHIEAYKQYGHDVVTVGVDVYNVEAEALGCEVRFYDNISIPGIVTRPLSFKSDVESIIFSPDLGRIGMILDAASEVRAAIGDEVNVGIGICGPFSILMELLGFEESIEALYDGDERVELFLEALLRFQEHYCSEIVGRGLGVTVFESWASPPLISPGMYKEFVLPYEKKLFAHLGEIGAVSKPLVIGGDTRDIVDSILDSGTTMLISDYNTPLPLYVQKAQKCNALLRANIDPKLVQSGSWEQIQQRVVEIRKQAEVYPKLIAGTGVIPYDTPPENILRVKQMFMAEDY